MSDMSNSKLRRLDGTLLLVFVEAYRLRKLTAVADRLGMTQSAVSHALARLRGLFDDQLFLRRPFGVEPTRRARELAPRLEAIVRLARETLAEPERFEPASSTREFRLTGLDFATALVGPRLIKRCRRSAPNVRLAFRALVREEALRALAEGEADVAIGHARRRRLADVAIEPLVEEPYRVAARQNHPMIRGTLDLKTYLALDHVSAAIGGDAGLVDRTLAAKGHSRRIIATVPMFLPALAAVAESDAVVTMPAPLIEAYKKRFQLRSYEPPFAIRPFMLSAAWHRRNDGDPGLRWLVDQLRACV